MRRIVKKEKQVEEATEEAEPVRTRLTRKSRDDSVNVESGQLSRQEDAEKRRVLRSKYLAVKTKINDARDEISNVDSNKFNIIIDEVDNLHQQVSKPREQVADAEALLGPMDNELKQRKCMVTRRRAVRPTDTARPDEAAYSGADEKTDTDKNMAMMFEILRRKRQVKLESLILNRSSFAQTVENSFALSFLVKDGKSEVVVDELAPKNAPDALSVTKGEVAFGHFVFRFDFEDWKRVPVGEELMLHSEDSSILFQAEPAARNSGALSITPIRKLSRNRGLILQESVIEDWPETDNASKGLGIRRCRRKLN